MYAYIVDNGFLYVNNEFPYANNYRDARAKYKRIPTEPGVTTRGAGPFRSRRSAPPSVTPLQADSNPSAHNETFLAGSRSGAVPCGEDPGSLSGVNCLPAQSAFKREDQDSIEAKYHLPQAWATYLEKFPWDWFVTIVPDDIIHPESLEKLNRVFIHHLNRKLYGSNYWKQKDKCVLWTMGWERQRRGAPHGHGLIGGIPDYMSRNQAYQFLKAHGAQFSKIEQYEKDRGAEYYMSKSTYAWKQGEIDVSDSLARYQGGSWVSPKEQHEQFCRDYSAITKPDVSAYTWSA